MARYTTAGHVWLFLCRDTAKDHVVRYTTAGHVSILIKTNKRFILRFLFYLFLSTDVYTLLDIEHFTRHSIAHPRGVHLKWCIYQRQFKVQGKCVNPPFFLYWIFNTFLSFKDCFVRTMFFSLGVNLIYTNVTIVCIQQKPIMQLLITGI